MSGLIRVLETALPVFMVLGLGMLCRRKKLFTREGIVAMKSFAVNLTLPAVLFSAFATAEYSARSVIVPSMIFGVCCAALLLGFLLTKLTRTSGKLAPFLMTGYEAGMLGYGLFALLYKDVPSSSFAIIDLGQVLFVFTIYKILLAGKGGLKQAAMDALRSPVLWAIVIGLIFGATGLYKKLEPSGVSGILDGCASFLAAPTSAVILLTIGYDLVPSEIKLGRTLKYVLLRVVIMGALLGLMLFVNKLMGGIMHKGALILMFILPPPYVLPVFTDAAEERADVSSSLSLLTVLSLGLFALMSALV